MAYNKKIAKALLALVCVVNLLLQLTTALPSLAAANELDVVFVLDDSRSMRDTDPDKLSVTAISKFVDSVASNIDASYAVAIYGEEANDTLGLGATVDEVKEFVNKYSKQDETYTNAAAGINWAAKELLENGRPNAEKVIILIGDGENDLNDYRNAAQTKEAEELSEQQKTEAVEISQKNGFPIYALAVNVEKKPGFREYFEELADDTQGKCFEPDDFDELQQYVDEILSAVTGAQVGGATPIPLTANTPVTRVETVEQGVYQMILQCDYEEPLEIWLSSPSGVQYDKNTVSSDCQYTDDTVNKYIQFKITNPEPGDWTVTYTSSVQQTITAKFIRYGDMKVTLKPTPGEVIEGKTSRYVAEVVADGETITDEATLLGFEPKICVVKLDKDGNRGKVEYTSMEVVSGQLSAEPKFRSTGEYEVFVELKGDTNTIESNHLTVTVEPDPNKIPLWLIILIILLVIVIIAVVIVVFIAMRNAPDYIKGDVAVKITAKTPFQETMIFQSNVFNCASVLNKQNTLSDLIRAYVNWYRSIGNGEWTEMTINRFLNASLAEVSDKIKLSGKKNGKTVVTVPKGFDIELDGNPVKSDRKIEFASSEKEMEIIINNNSHVFIVELLFTR